MPWRGVAYRVIRPLLFRFDSEHIHRLSLEALRIAGSTRAGRRVAALAGGVSLDESGVELARLRFRSRVGLAAGFDKDAIALLGWASLGLGFAEVGTVTPLPQPGSARPRLFRLPQDEALVNRMGFNNAGAEVVARNLDLARRRLPDGFVVGVNIGRNAATQPEDSVRDYLAAQRQLAPLADYLAVNVSSPNTPGLRDLQAPGRLRALLDALSDAGERLGCARPIFVKLAPDLGAGDLEAVLGAVLEIPAQGLILSNTTTGRDRLSSPEHLTGEGRPLRGAAAGPHPRCGPTHAGAGRRPADDHRLGWDRLGRGRRRPRRSRRRPRPAVDRPGVRGAGSDRRGNQSGRGRGIGLIR